MYNEDTEFVGAISLVELPATTTECQVWARPLEGGDVAVGLYNAGNESHSMSINISSVFKELYSLLDIKGKLSAAPTVCYLSLVCENFSCIFKIIKRIFFTLNFLKTLMSLTCYKNYITRNR